MFTSFIFKEEALAAFIDYIFGAGRHRSCSCGHSLCIFGRKELSPVVEDGRVPVPPGTVSQAPDAKTIRVKSNEAPHIAPQIAGKTVTKKENGEKITKYGRAMLLEKTRQPNHPLILYVQGTPYEMGYQHGILLADRLTRFYSEFFSPVFFMTGGWEPGAGEPTQEQLQAGRDAQLMASKKYFLKAIKKKAPDYYEEMQGMADALKDSGSSVKFDDLLTMACAAEVLTLPGQFLKSCSNIAVWGKGTGGGKLIHGVNQDFEDFGAFHRYVTVVIARPEKGHAFLGLILPGLPWALSGINDAGISVGEMTSVSIDEGANMAKNPEIPHTMHMRRLIQYTDSTQSAGKIIDQFGGTSGWNIVVADAKVPTAVDLEVSWGQTGVVRPMKGVDAIWSTNHSNTYPGWQGYPEDGPNLVLGQMAHWGVPWEKVYTIKKWQKWLKVNKSGTYGTYTRYEKFRDFYEQNQGKIDVQK
ncbi:MAG: C45 family autoproteolytic acyltransferase/hydrolase, partial [Desulfocucumaceae bacterium]